jgi:hypothetical protein
MFREIEDKIFTVQQIFKMMFQLTHQKKEDILRKNNCMLCCFSELFSSTDSLVLMSQQGEKHGDKTRRNPTSSPSSASTNRLLQITNKLQHTTRNKKTIQCSLLFP